MLQLSRLKFQELKRILIEVNGVVINRHLAIAKDEPEVYPTDLRLEAPNHPSQSEMRIW